MFHDGHPKNDGKIKVDKAHLPTNAGNDIVEGTLQGGCGVFGAKKHPCVPVSADMCSKSRLVFVPFRSRSLPVAGATIKCQEDNSVI